LANNRRNEDGSIVAKPQSFNATADMRDYEVMVSTKSCSACVDAKPEGVRIIN